MKKGLAVLLLTFALSFPCFAGHTVPGNLYCDCGTPGCVQDYPGECGLLGQSATQNDTPKDVTSELGIAIVALLLWLRLRA
jgi:hypothetical protein